MDYPVVFISTEKWKAQLDHYAHQLRAHKLFPLEKPQAFKLPKVF